MAHRIAASYPSLVALTLVAACRPPPQSDSTIHKLDAATSEAHAAREQQTAAIAEVTRAEQAEAAAYAALAAAEAWSAEANRYEALLAEAATATHSCALTPDRLIKIRGELALYNSEPRRDAVLAALEPCRRSAIPARTLEHERVQAGLRVAYAATIEQEFDASNPDERGQLVATVSGTTLRVDMKQYRAWRPRDAQAAVDTWCRNTTHFTAIELRGARGTFRCRPEQTPRQYVQAELRADGLDEPWTTPPAGGRPTPRSVTELESLRQAATQAEQATYAATSHATYTRDYALSAQERVDRLEQGEHGRLDAWQARRNEHKGRAAIPLLISGTLSSLGGLVAVFCYLAYDARAGGIEQGNLEFDNQREYDDALRSARRSSWISIGVALPLAAYGLAGTLLGIKWMQHRHRVSLTPGGLRLRF